MRGRAGWRASCRRIHCRCRSRWLRRWHGPQCQVPWGAGGHSHRCGRQRVRGGRGQPRNPQDHACRGCDDAGPLKSLPRAAAPRADPAVQPWFPHAHGDHRQSLPGHSVTVTVLVSATQWVRPSPQQPVNSSKEKSPCISHLLKLHGSAFALLWHRWCAWRSPRAAVAARPTAPHPSR